MHKKSDALLASFSTHSQPFHQAENNVSAINRHVEQTDYSSAASFSTQGKPHSGFGNAGNLGESSIMGPLAMSTGSTKNTGGAHQDGSGAGSRDGKPRIKCTKEWCSKTFTREYDMCRHLKGHQDDPPLFFCPERKCPRNQEWEDRRDNFELEYGWHHIRSAAVFRGYQRKDNLLAHQKKTGHGLDNVLQEEPGHTEKNTSDVATSSGEE